MVTIHTKSPVGKKLGPSNLGVEVPNTEALPQRSYRKMRDRQAIFYIARYWTPAL